MPQYVDTTLKRHQISVHKLHDSDHRHYMQLANNIVVGNFDLWRRVA